MELGLVPIDQSTNLLNTSCQLFEELALWKIS